ncbi:MAG TPA: phosphatidate cytidylyltransferase [Acidimicrobiales bacterium]|nr:phosphatidate cytidylyltransferase [Acidimicrobiales bacterium]
MSDRNKPAAKGGRPSSEGVRIIKAEEAQAALDAGEAAGRRPDDQLRFGDVPPAPSGPRPAHRFPLPDSVDPAAAVALPPLASRGQGEESPAPPPAPAPPEYRRPADDARDARPGSAPDALDARPRPVADEPAARTPTAPPEGDDDMEADAPPWAERPLRPAFGADRTTELSVEPGPSVEVPEAGITVSGGSTELPHWSDPPTGEVPRLRFDKDEDEPSGEDDMAAWRALGSRGVRWRHEDDWDDVDEMADLVGEDDPVGALDQTRTEHSDIYSFDEDFERVTANRTGSHPVVDLTGVEEEPDDEQEWAPEPAQARRRGRTEVSIGRNQTASSAAGAPSAAGVAGGSVGAAGGSVGTSTRPAPAGRPGVNPRRRPAPGEAARRTRPGGGTGPGSGSGAASGEIGSRVAVGAGLIALLIIASIIGPVALVVLATVVVTAAAAEAYNMTRAPGFRPATLLGLVATVGCVLGAYYKGIGAIPVVAVLLFAGSMLWYVLGVVEARPLANVAVTVMVFMWVSVLGSFAAVLLQERHGEGLFLGAVLVAVAADICAFGVGRSIGSRPLAPNISPNKTLEGFFGGLVGSLIVGAIIGKELTPWAGMKHGLVLGLVVGLIAPAGDLFESMLKRDLGIKDSGSVLAGHGGLLDRFDGLLLALPVAYFVATFFHL